MQNVDNNAGSDGELSSVDRIFEALNVAGGAGSIRIHAQPGGYREDMPLLEIVDVEDFGDDEVALIRYIQGKWGGGRYRLFFREQGRNGNVRNVPLLLEGDPIRASNTPAAAAPAVSVADQVAAAVRDALAPLAGVLQRAAAPAPTDDEQEERLLRRMERYKSLMGLQNEAAQDPWSRVDGVLGFLGKLGLQVQGPGADNETAAERIVDRVLPVVGELFALRVPPAAPAAAESTESTAGGVMTVPIETALHVLAGLAKVGHPIEAAADLVMPRIDRAEVRALCEQGIEAALARLVELSPVVGEYSEWFRSLVSVVGSRLGVQW